MTAAAQSPPRDDGASRRRVSPRVIGLILAALVILAMALDTTYKKGDVKTTASGRKAFDPVTYGKETFPKAVDTVDKDAVALPKLLAALRKDQDAASEKYGKREGTSPYAFAASGTGVAGAAEGALMQVKVPGVPKATRVSLQVGPALNGTSIRDAVGFIKFGQFTNQVEYADAGTALNNQVKARVLKGIDPKTLQGKRVKFVGAFTLITPDVVTITPVRLEPQS